MFQAAYCWLAVTTECTSTASSSTTRARRVRALCGLPWIACPRRSPCCRRLRCQILKKVQLPFKLGLTARVSSMGTQCFIPPRISSPEPAPCLSAGQLSCLLQWIAELLLMLGSILWRDIKAQELSPGPEPL